MPNVRCAYWYDWHRLPAMRDVHRRSGMCDMKHRHPQPRCSKCNVLLSREYPYDLCTDHWREKYHAEPGTNYFPPDKAAMNPAEALTLSFCGMIAVRLHVVHV